jgi:methionyl-tRNA formyltransferase
MSMTIVFMGTAEFAVPTLRILHEHGYAIQAVVTQPDRPKGRGQQVIPPPVKVLAEQHQIPVLQPEKIRAPEVQHQLQTLAPDVVVVVAYGQILPKAILQIPKLGCINVHASLLPKYRGAAPIQWALIRGEHETGVTTMFMDAGMDTGDILLQQPVAIAAEETAGTLREKLSEVGAALLLETLQRLAQGAITPIPQPHEAATYAPLLQKEDGRIVWQESARHIVDRVRGCFPWPGAYTFWQGKMIKLLKVTTVPDIENVSALVPGTIVALTSEGPIIATSDGYIRLLEIQPENKNPMRCSDFCRGYHLAVGDKFGT